MNMNIQQKKERYERPEVAFLELEGAQNILVNFSISGDVDDIEDAGEWDDNTIYVIHYSQEPHVAQLR